jgi:hypothetical protein
MAKKLTPELLRRIVLEEKAKIEAKHGLASKESKKAMREMELEPTEMEEDYAGPQPTKGMKPSAGHKAGKVSGYEPAKKANLEKLEESEQILLRRLRVIRERKSQIARGR